MDRRDRARLRLEVTYWARQNLGKPLPRGVRGMLREWADMQTTYPGYEAVRHTVMDLTRPYRKPYWGV